MLLFAVQGVAVEPTVFSASSDSSSTVREVPFGPGEKMVFNITYGIVVAGEATLEVAGVTEYQGHLCYNIQSKTMSTPATSAPMTQK